jgi:hypothetical protein
MPTRTDNTFQEELTKLLTTIAGMKVLPDADLAWLANLETMVLSKLRAPIDSIQQQGLTSAPAPGGGAPGSSLGFNGAPSPGGMDGGTNMPPQAMPPQQPAGTGQGVNGVPSMVGGNINPDELRRLIGQG